MTPFEITKTFEIHFELIENLSKIVEKDKTESATALSEMLKKIEEHAGRIEAQNLELAQLKKNFFDRLQAIQMSRALLVAHEIRKYPDVPQAVIAARFGITSAAVSLIAKRYNLRKKPKEQAKTQSGASPSSAISQTASAGAQQI